MRLTEDVRNRMIAMMDYIAARSVEFGGADIHMSIGPHERGGMHATISIGNIYTDGLEHHRLIGTPYDRSWFSGWRDCRYATEEEVKTE